MTGYGSYGGGSEPGLHQGGLGGKSPVLVDAPAVCDTDSEHSKQLCLVEKDRTDVYQVEGFLYFRCVNAVSRNPPVDARISS